MSKDDFIEDGEQELTEGLDSNESVEEAEEEEVVKKKSSLPMMAAVGVGVAAVVGFAGFKIYNQMFAAPPAPMMDAGPIVAPVVQQAPAQIESQPPAPVVPAPVVPAPVALDPQPAAVAPAPVVDVQTSALPSPMTSPAVLAGAGVDMSAVMELKAATEAQAKKVSAIEEKIVTLEQRIAALEAGKPVAQAKTEKPAKASSGEKLAKASEHKKAKKVAQKTRDSKKRGSEWKKSVEKPSDTISRSRTQLLEKLKAAEAAVASTAKSTEAVLPPAPDFGPKPEPVKTEAKVQPIAKQESSASVTTPKAESLPALPTLPVAKPVSVSGLKVQAVIPGRVWLSDGNGPTRSYAVGDVVRAGVVIRSIDADSAVVTTSAGTLK